VYKGLLEFPLRKSPNFDDSVSVSEQNVDNINPIPLNQSIYDYDLEKVSSYNIIPVVNKDGVFQGIVLKDKIIKDLQNRYKELIQIIDSSHDGIAISNSAGTTEWVNKAWDRITGLNRSDVIGRPLNLLVE